MNVRHLSHHAPLEEDRCLRVPHGGKTILVCARCTGVVIGMVIGAPLWILIPPTAPLIGILALPAFIDWTLHMTNVCKGWNHIRVATGIGLGLAYVAFLITPFTGGDVAGNLVLIGLCLLWGAGIHGWRRYRVRKLFGW